MPFVRPLVSIVCVAAAAMALGAPGAFAATPGTAYELTSIDTPFPQPTGRFGERHAATDDIDGDGVNDYFVGALSEDVSQFTNAGRVYAISGRTRTVIYDFISPEIQNAAQFGFFIVVLGDVDGDGKNDLASGTDAQDTTPAGDPCTPTTPATPACNDGQGKAWVFSGGKRGRLLYEVDNPAPQPDTRFGSRIGRAGDVTGDGVPESIIGASNNDVPVGCATDGTVEEGCRRNQGQAYIFDGKDGTLVRELNIPASDQVPATCSGRGANPGPAEPCGNLGLSVQGPGDVDGDGVTDQLVNASSLSVTNEGDVCAPGSAGCNTGQGAMYLFSGRTGDVLARIDDPAPQSGATFGFQDAAPLSPGDVNGDGRADLFANGFTQNGPGPGVSIAEGRIWVFDGRATVDRPAEHGVVLYEPRDPTPSEGGQFAFSLDRTDYNKDGRPDLYVGQSPHQVSGTDQSGGTYIFDGRDGSLLKSLELPADVRQLGSPGDLGSNLGWSVAAPGDLNGDGEPDYLAGATWQNVGENRDEGRAFVFLSNVPASGPGP
ncbi:MAG: integrin alpha, partial [Actinomycetota bacterium]|nr:integrin alpha [Actinomycetota bacterium]